ncbi:MAG: phosphoserine phosphatase SerB [Alphaproteobacteria bacterium]|nr:phosphoserine phosphatase SerB [Alphaproteobacteria bacterium]
MFTATLIAAQNFDAGDISAAADHVASAGAQVLATRWVEPNKALDVDFSGDAVAVRAAVEQAFVATDAIVQPTAQRARTLIVADMDSTMITIECIDELADYAGIKPQIAEVTERAMRGELDFESALRSRVALLKGLPEAVIAQCLAERVVIMPGAKELVRTMRAHGGHAVLVSGGFTRFAEPVAAEIGFNRAIANVLGIRDGLLTGDVEGEIVGAATKKQVLEQTRTALGLGVDDSLAVGDGANDIPMIETAGLGVAYHAKPKTAAAAPARIDHGDLTAILYAMGYPRAAWAMAV